jgi:RimJ/RimL family protein N-acetyltransferase
VSVLEGDLIRLAAVRSPEEAELQARWQQDSEFARLLTSNVHQPVTGQWLRETYEEFKTEVKPDLFVFIIRTRRDDHNIGFVGLEDVEWVNGNAWLGIGIGERAYWGRGYGTDAVRVSVRYAFTELDLNRVSLSVFAYNARALCAYQRVGFVIEGRARNRLSRDGQHWDLVYMGILREEWVRLMSRDA